MFETEDLLATAGAESAPDGGITLQKTLVEKETKDMKPRTDTSLREVEATKLIAEMRIAQDIAHTVPAQKVEEDKEITRLVDVDTDLKLRKADQANVTAITTVDHDTANIVPAKKVEEDKDNARLSALANKLEIERNTTVKQKDFERNPDLGADAAKPETQLLESEISRFSSVETVLENSTVKSEVSAGEGIDQGKIAEEEVKNNNSPHFLDIIVWCKIL